MSTRTRTTGIQTTGTQTTGTMSSGGRTSRTLLRGGWVLPMTPGARPSRGDVLVEDDRIAAVGELGEVADAAVVDARERLVLPGLVDTHRHLWQSALRGIACDWTLGEYFARMRGRLGGHFRPEDTYAGTLLGAVEALDAGITTVVDWSHNINGPDHADAAWQALTDAGGRAVFAYGASNAQALGEPTPHTRDVARLRAEVAGDDGARVMLGMALRGPEFSGPDLAAADLTLARELGLPVTMHVGGGLRGASRHVAALAERGLLGPDTTYVHCNMLADDETCSPMTNSTRSPRAGAGPRSRRRSRPTWGTGPRPPPGCAPAAFRPACRPTSARTSAATCSARCGSRWPSSAAPRTPLPSAAATPWRTCR
jgi:Amidohydrolase family